MKQVDKIVKKGEYYQIEVVDDGLLSSKPYKKEEIQSALQSHHDNILTLLPPFSQARAKYYFSSEQPYSTADADQLLHQLQHILISAKLSDEDKQEINKVIRQIKILKEEPLVNLSELTPIDKIVQKEKPRRSEVQLHLRVDIKELQQKVTELEKFPYPELTTLQQQLEVLLNDKKPATTKELPKDERNKEQIDNLYAQLSSLTCPENLPAIVDRIHANGHKYSEMGNWAAKIEQTSAFHSDFLAELKEDELLLAKLEQNFKQNVEVVKARIEQIRAEAKK